MTSPDDIQSAKAFEAALSDLVHAAASNGVDPRGAWQHTARDGEADFEIEIVELDTGGD